MTRSWKLFLSGALALTMSASQAGACGPLCGRPAPDSPPFTPGLTSSQGPQGTFSQGSGRPSPNGIAANGDVINDLPAGAKLAIRAAARKAGKDRAFRTVAQRVDAAPGTVAPAPAPATAPTSALQTNRNPTFNDRMAQVIATEQNLAIQTTRLETKRAELERWDEAAQVKFRQAFGTVDEAARQRVIQIVSQQIARNRQMMAALAEGVNLDFYLQTKQQR